MRITEAAERVLLMRRCRSRCRCVCVCGQLHSPVTDTACSQSPPLGAGVASRGPEPRQDSRQHGSSGVARHPLSSGPVSGWSAESTQVSPHTSATCNRCWWERSCVLHPVANVIVCTCSPPALGRRTLCVSSPLQNQEAVCQTATTVAGNQRSALLKGLLLQMNCRAM